MADNSLATKNLNEFSALSNSPTHIKYAEIVHDNAPFGKVVKVAGPVAYYVFDIGGPNPGEQVSSAAANFILNGGSYNDVDKRGDGLIPAANQHFINLPGFPSTAPTVAPLIVQDVEVLHSDAPNRPTDLLNRLRIIAPNWFP